MAGSGPRSAGRPVLGFVLATCLSLGVVEAWHEWSQRRTEITQTETGALNVARAVSREADDAVRLVDTVLFGIGQRLRADRSPESLARLGASMALAVSSLGQISGLFAFDQDGRWLASSLAGPTAHVEEADRAFFRHHRSDPSPAAHLGEPILSRTTGRWVLTVSRRLDRPDGGFGGVVAATLDVDALASRFTRFDMGRSGTVALMTRDGRLLVRHPYDQDHVGRDVSATPLFSQDLARQSSGIGHYVSPLDGVTRIGGYATSDSYSLVAYAAIGRDEALAAWRDGALLRAVLLALLWAVFAGFGLKLSAHIRGKARAEDELRRGESRFRLLAENSGDVVSSLDLDGTYLYVSPAAGAVLGRDPAAMVGRRFADDMVAEEAVKLKRAFRTLTSGHAETATATHRGRHRARDREAWFETTIRLVRAPGTGVVAGIVATTRDVTERKRLEEELASLARTDGLTGLRNRRAFDETQSREWRRSVRDGTALSLALFDLDRFKLFNDRLGHPAGDACLTAAAAAIASCCRPGDLVARYGGEEIALVMPRTDEAVAAEVAERVRAAVAALAIAHPANAGGVVTLSGGVATRLPGSALRNPSDVVRAADVALYQAKQAGRNRVVSAAPEPACRLVG